MTCVICQALEFADPKGLAWLALDANRRYEKELSRVVELSITCESQWDRIRELEDVVRKQNQKIQALERKAPHA